MMKSCAVVGANYIDGICGLREEAVENMLHSFSAQYNTEQF